MISKPKLLFGCYVACVLVFFGITGSEVFAHTQASRSSVIDWTWVPGGFLAGWTFGVHSDQFILGALLWNIAVYLLVPYPIWKVISSVTKPRSVTPGEGSSK